MGKSKNKYKHLAGLDKGTKLLVQTGVLKERPPGIPFPVRGKKNNSKRNLRKQKAETVDCTEEIPNKASVNSVVLQKKDGKQEFLNAINQKNCDEISMPSSETSTTSLKVERNNNNNKLTNDGVKSEDDYLSPMGKQNNSFDSSSQLSNANKSGSCEIQFSVNFKARKQQRKLDLKTRLCSKLQGSYFRWINEMLYTSSSEEVAKLFSEDPHSFAKYHEGYELQVSKWPVNPLDMLVNWFQKKPKTWIVSDMGCGNAKLQSLIKQKVYSFDFVALNPNVIACDMSHVPLSDENVDVCIFSLSLMGSNIADYILESNRILRIDGILIIIEILSRFQSLRKFRKAVENFGFEFKQQNLIKNYFIWFKFLKKGRPQKTRAIVYKAPGEANGKIIEATAAAAWNNGAQALSSDNGHSFATALQNVVRDNPNVKFLAYNNAPPGVSSIKTKSNSKGVIILSTTTDSAAWIVHTVPGFPGAKTGYSWPVAENARGHLLICLTISESQINAIAASLLLVQPVIYYNDIPQTETAGMPYFNKLADGKISTLPPFTSRQTIRTQAANPVTVHIYSKSEAILYKAPGQATGKIIEATDAARDWQDGAQPLNNNAQHSFATALQHVVGDNPNVKFLAYNNAPPGVPSIKTKSNSKGIIILSIAPATDSAAWIVHTVPGFPAAKTGYNWPLAENARGHLLICLTISESQINAIEIYKKVIVKVLKKTIKVWSRRDSKLKGDCRGSQRHIRLIKSPAVVVDHNTNLEADITNWAVSDPGNIFCHIDKPYLCFFSQIYHNLKYQNVGIEMVLITTIVYKAPGQDNGKIILATAAAAWDNGAQALSRDNGHSFAMALQHVVGNDNSVKFLAYNNAPPGVPSIKTKSNNKGVIILSTTTDSAAWIVHTVPGFPAAKTGYNWPLAENARGHLLICLTISESQINAIAASLLLVQPVIYYNDIPKTETAAMPYFNKLAEGKTSTLPPFTSRQTIRTQSANPLTVHIYSKSESSKYEIYKKVIVKVLKKTIKVWSRRDSKLKGDCRGSQRHIRLIKSPAVVRDHNTYLELDITNWAVSDPGNLFCHIDKPYFKNQTREPAMAICIDNNEIFARFNEIAAQIITFSNLNMAIVYKAPGQDTGKIIFATVAGAWDDGAQPLSNVNQHSFAKTLEDVVRNQNNIKFLAYNNAPPGVPNVNTKSNSKGVMILSTAANSAAWIVHTVPGFPTARTPYSWPVAENARGHLLICLTISKSQINVIAASLLLVQPMVHYNDIPETETAGMPYFNKLAEGKIPTVPPFTSRRSISTENARGPVAVHIYSKSESSKYAAINGHNTNLEADITNWAVSDPGSIFCHIDKPYFKNQTREPAMAICIENNEIFARFNEIAAQVEDCPQ
ncbi:Ribosomal RNA-processing protein 8, partial [Trichinella nelsoni]